MPAAGWANRAANWRWHGSVPAELQARMADARNRYQQAATEELKQSSARLRELEERLRPSKDQVERQSIRSPVDGVVMGLRVSAPGEVLAAGAPIARRGAQQ